MLDFLSTLFQLLAPLWEMSVTAAYAAAVVIVLRLLLKKRAPRQVLCLLWLVVFARLLIPVSLKSPLSIVPDALPGQEQQILLPNQPSGVGQPVTPNQPANDTVTPVTSNPAAPSLTIPEGVAPAAPQPEAPAPFPWQAVLAGVWLAGMAALTLYALLSYVRLRRCLFDAIRAEDGAWEHPAVNSPFILGFIRPRIYLPAGLAGQPRQFILCHERAHLRRLDHIVKPVCWVALALHWFNPVVWAAYILMSRDIEAACDEAVIRRLGPRVKADYSATLLALATNRRVPAPCPLAFDEGDAKGRIKNVLRYRRPALWIVVVSVIAAVLAAVCLLTDPVAAKEPDADPSADPSPSAASSPAPVDPADTLLDPWMREILDGERTFRDFYREHNYGDSRDYTIHQLRSYFYGDDELPKVTVELGRLTVIDLDNDGINEMVIWPTGEHEDPTEVGYYTGYLVLRRKGDQVYGYAPGWRSIGDLKADGTFEWSGSAFEWGTGSASFDADGVFAISNITWCDNGVDKENYFVNGLSATQEEFEAAYAAQRAKPDPTWYTYKDGVLARILPSIPLSEYTLSIPVPDFLDAEQQLIYRQAYELYRRLFSAMNDEADFWLEAGDNLLEPAENVERDGFTYTAARGLYGLWNDFEQATLSVFTQDFWNSKNTIQGGSGSADLYINVNGRMYYAMYGRGATGCSAQTFRLVERTDSTISFVMTGYYIDPYQRGDETIDEHIARLNGDWEYSIDFPMRMVKTADGWRFDEFYSAATDCDISPFANQKVPNPNAPAAVTSSPEPSPDPTPSTSPVPDPEDTPSAAPAACEHGLDNAVSGWSNGHLVFTCELDGTAYPVPAVTQGDWEPGISEDFDGDGHVEHSFFQNGRMMIVDIAAGQLVTSIFDPSSTFAAFDQGNTWEMAEDYTALTVSYLGRTVQVPLYISGGTSYPEVAVARPFTPETTYPYTGYVFRGDHFDMSSPVNLGKVYVDQVSLAAHWSVRYTGGGFQVLSDSFQFELVSR